MSVNLAIALFMLMAAIAQTQGFGVRMIPVPKSQSFSTNNITLHHQNLVQLSKTHVARRFMSPADKNATSLKVSRAFSGFLYVEVYLGTPPMKINLALDTWNDFTWVQCAECTKCFPVALPNFDRRSSPTFKPMFYDDPLCSSLSHDHPDAGNERCYYLVSSLNGQISEGEIGFDTFTLYSENGEAQPIPHVSFGCGLVNDIDAGPEGQFSNQIGGVLGLQKGRPLSILQQLRTVTLQRFSYCLPLDLELGNETVLYFGDGAELSGPGVQTTDFLDDYYRLKLNAISINGELLPIDPALFMPPVSDGFYIDSGTVNSLLVGPVYDILQQGMVDYFRDYYGWLPLNTSARLDHYELCYEIPSEGWYVSPTLTFHFEGTANLELNDEHSMFKVFDQANQFCMTILPLGSNEGSPNILGALQQANYRFLFDAAASKLSFAKDIC